MPSTEGEILKLTIYLGGFALISLVSAIIFLVFLCLEGTPGTNRYGPNPKDQK